MYLLHRKKNVIYTNISLFLSYSEITVATRSSPYPAIGTRPREPNESFTKSGFAAVGIELFRLARGELAPRLSLISPNVFSPFCLQWSFGSLPLSPLACLVGETYFPAISST